MNWKIEYDIPDISDELLDAGYNPLLASVLTIRGYRDFASANRLINGNSDNTHDPMIIKGMKEAVVRIKRAIQSGEKIAVYGDYDVDGITATALLTDYLRSRNIYAEPYIPDRNEEGYGLNKDALKGFKERGISLVITVDCGITSVEEAEYAQAIGLDLIVTDHHECKESYIPKCCAVIDCKQPGDNYPNHDLAGVGMAFKLVCAIDGNIPAILNKYCDLLAVGTVADVMPLTDENRIFVRFGLEKLKRNPRKGIKSLMSKADMKVEQLSSSSISYMLAPRLNAAGRLGKAINAEALLLAEDDIEADKLAEGLCALNKERQEIENKIWMEAKDMLKDFDSSGPIVIANNKWNPGVIGIAASRLAEHFAVPAIIICLNDNSEKNSCLGKGSCRSYGGFNLFNALQACSDNLLSFGGHALAAGLNIEKDKIDDFREKITKYYKENVSVTVPELECELLITEPELLNVENVKSLDLLEPYGNGNPKPVFCMTGVLLEQSAMVGNGKHLKMRININGKKFDCIYFSVTNAELGIRDGDFIDIAFTPQINEFRGSVSVQLTIVAARKHDSSFLCNDIKTDLHYKKAIKQFKVVKPDFVRLWNDARKNSRSTLQQPNDMVDEKYHLCCRVFHELGLIDSEGNILPSTEKRPLENNETFKMLNEL